MPIPPRASQPTSEPVPHVFPPWGVDVFESHHAEGWTMPRVAHEFMKLILVHDGQGQLEANGQVLPCKKGDALVIPIGLEHTLADSADEPMSLYVVSIQSHILEASCFAPDTIPSGIFSLDEHEATKVERSMRRLLFEQTLDVPTTGAQMVALTLRLVVEIARIIEGRIAAAAKESPLPVPTILPMDGVDTATRMHGYIDDLSENFFEATNLDAAASALGISRRRFTQLFREITGSSWLSHVRKLRVDHARNLIENTDRTVLSVAFECGFEDLSTFYRAFKRETGVSPNKWRRGSDEDEPTPA